VGLSKAAVAVEACAASRRRRRWRIEDGPRGGVEAACSGRRLVAVWWRMIGGSVDAALRWTTGRGGGGGG
jgi:hypothetical protein